MQQFGPKKTFERKCDEQARKASGNNHSERFVYGSHVEAPAVVDAATRGFAAVARRHLRAGAPFKDGLGDVSDVVKHPRGIAIFGLIHVAGQKRINPCPLVFFALPVLAELVLRAARVPFDAQLYGPDCALGWRLRPGASGRVSTETPQWVRINSRGFRDRERTFEKPADTFRIAVLGNSWTEALQVPQEKTYTAVLEQQLNDRKCFAGKRVEVLNFGVAGYSTAQELLLLRQKVWNYHPDLILLAIYPARDIANNIRELNNAVTPERSPYFVFRGEQLALDDSFRSLPALQPWQIRLQSTEFWFDDHFRTLEAINTVQRYGKIRVAMAAARERAEQSGMDNLEYAIYAPPSTPAMQQAWK